MSTRLPPLLTPYLALPPPSSLLLLTGVLGASTNWLVLRYLHSLLNIDSTNQSRVLLVSFLRDLSFWRDGAARLGLDLQSARGFAFVDALTGLFVSGTGGRAGKEARRLDSAAVGDLDSVISGAVEDLAEGAEAPVVLILDGLDFWLAATGDHVSSLRARDMLLDWREKVHTTILTLSADEPLVAAQTTALEKEHASLVISLAHDADAILSLRLLDTGTARDVSGVVRITRGGASGRNGFKTCASENGSILDEKEYLYHVGADGGVRVFERGQLT